MTTTTILRPWLTTTQAGAVMGISANTVRSWVRLGMIPPHAVRENGRNLMINAAWIRDNAIVTNAQEAGHATHPTP